MTTLHNIAPYFASFTKSVARLGQRSGSNKIIIFKLFLVTLALSAGLGFAINGTTAKTEIRKNTKSKNRNLFQGETGPRTYYPTSRGITVAPPINLAELARQEALEPTHPVVAEIKAIEAPKGSPPSHTGPEIRLPAESGVPLEAPTPSSSGVSPGPTKTFKGEFLSGTTIPPDTMGAVGTTHVVTPSNDRLRIQDRDGVELSRVTLNSFWSTATVKGVAVSSAFDTKVFFDRFNNHFILVSSLNGPGINSGMGVAVTQTADPTGTWNRYTAASDPASTVGAGHAIDYPSVGFNKNWIVVDENTFNYSGSSFTTYYGQQVFVLDKAAAYAGTLSSVSLFEGPVSGCVSPFEGQLGCGFTMAPAITEDNTTDTDYMVEDWDSTAAQLRLSKITGTPSTPVVTVGTQFPQSTNSWRFDARRIGTTGGYVPQRQQAAYLVSGTRMMANDSRIQNAVYRAGSLWTTHTVMLSTAPQPAGTAIGGAGNPIIDNHSAIQWWQIDPTIETGLATVPIQRARIEDATADNCHDGNGGTLTTGPCTSTATQHGTFFAFPNISVNMNNDVLIGFTQFSAFTYPSSSYAVRLAGDVLNTVRDPVVFHSGQANYNIGAGAGGTTARQNRWGDYSAAQTDPLDDTTFWTVQEYAGTVRDFGIGLAGNWETWYAQVKTSTAAPLTTGNLIISEFRLRGPQGINDEFVELYNPGASSVYVSTADNSDGWALVYSANGTTATGITVIPNGTVIPAKGHYLIARDPDAANGPTVTYSLNGYAANPVRAAESDTGYSVDNADNGGFAIFKSALASGWTVGNRMDSAGFNSIAAGLFKEGAGIPAISATTPTGQMTFYRDLSAGSPKDTGANENDFVFADPVAETLTVVPKLGAAGPENLDGPVHNTTGTMSLPTRAPNFVYDPTPITNGTFGNVTVSRSLVNSTGGSISRVRFRVVDLTTRDAFGEPPVNTADLRLLTSANLTLEEPPTQAIGGGFNSSANVAAVTLAAPLANGASTPIDFKFGVNQVGCFHFAVIAEALPGGASTVFGFQGSAGGVSCAPTAAPGTISGRVAGNDGGSLAGTTVQLAGGSSRTTITDSNGNYHFSNLDSGQFYTVTPSLANYHFAPVNRSFSLVGDRTDAAFTGSADASQTANAVDTTEYFVRQHYLDFLGREPDQGGFEYWTGQINQCNGDANCVRNKRIDVSAAFFASPEFQQTGSFIYELYAGALGRMPNYNEFMPDRSQVVGGPNLEAARVAFTDAFVQRAEFTAKYPQALTRDQFVDALLQTMTTRSGADVSSLRDTMLSDYDTGGRSLALRDAVQANAFAQAEYNKAFVLMEYFGYLRRNPDTGGYDFWLDVLNGREAGNYRGMVCAFLTSSEYQLRFSSVVTHSNADCSGVR